MPKPNKRNMPLQRSTAFWKSLGIEIGNRAKELKKYRPNSEKGNLRRTKVSEEAIEYVYDICETYEDDLFFKKLSLFFRIDVNTVKTWTKTKTASAAFIKLFNIYHKSTFQNAKKRYSELALIFEFYRKGERQKFLGHCKDTINLKNFSTTNLRRRLTFAGGGSQYAEMGKSDFGKEVIIWLQKNTKGKKTNKFIKLSKQGKKLYVSLSMDSQKEYYICRNEIGKKFNTVLETPEVVAPDFTKFFSFLRTGESTHFILSGSTYLDSEFRVSITPSHSRIENVAELDTYKSKISSGSGTKKIANLAQIRLSYKDHSLSRPIFISFLTYRDGVFGAMLLNPDDKGLTAVQRKKLYEDFESDFELSLNCFLLKEDLTEQALYKYFLETVPTKVLKIELRSSRALSIYTSLIQENLLVLSDTTEEVAKLCVNSTCRGYFKPIWQNKKHCPICNDILINGRSIQIKKINEESIGDFIQTKFSLGIVTNIYKSLLTRKILVCQVTYNGETVDFIPLSKQLTESQILLLKYRYPHAVIVTTRPDKEEIISKGCRAVSLWELVYSVFNENSKVIKDFARRARANSLAGMRTLCTTSIDRIIDTAFYKAKNSEIKNLGAELFEADCSILFDYVFGNCLWLGAKYKGVSLPDGFTSFPMLETSKGCFIWDGKFSEGRKLVMGKYSKNLFYISEAKGNRSIKDNGGLRGFVFISNNTFPPSFIKKYTPLTKGRRLKVSFIQADQFRKIVEHYQQNERVILNTVRARNQFSNSMIDLFFTTALGRKCEIISDLQIETHITANNAYFATLPEGRTLRP